MLHGRHDHPNSDLPKLQPGIHSTKYIPCAVPCCKYDVTTGRWDKSVFCFRCDGYRGPAAPFTLRLNESVTSFMSRVGRSSLLVHCSAPPLLQMVYTRFFHS